MTRAYLLLLIKTIVAQDARFFRHHIENSVEGQDYYHDRSNPMARFEHKMYDDTALMSMSQRFFTGPIRVPNMTAAELEIEILAKEGAFAAIMAGPV